MCSYLIIEVLQLCESKDVEAFILVIVTVTDPSHSLGDLDCTPKGNHTLLTLSVSMSPPRAEGTHLVEDPVVLIRRAFVEFAGDRRYFHTPL